MSTIDYIFVTGKTDEDNCGDMAPYVAQALESANLSKKHCQLLVHAHHKHQPQSRFFAMMSRELINALGDPDVMDEPFDVDLDERDDYAWFIRHFKSFSSDHPDPSRGERTNVLFMFIVSEVTRDEAFKTITSIVSMLEETFVIPTGSCKVIIPQNDSGEHYNKSFLEFKPEYFTSEQSMIDTLVKVKRLIMNRPWNDTSDLKIMVNWSNTDTGTNQHHSPKTQAKKLDRQKPHEWSKPIKVPSNSAWAAGPPSLAQTDGGSTIASMLTQSDAKSSTVSSMFDDAEDYVSVDRSTIAAMTQSSTPVAPKAQQMVMPRTEPGLVNQKQLFLKLTEVVSRHVEDYQQIMSNVSGILPIVTRKQNCSEDFIEGVVLGYLEK